MDGFGADADILTVLHQGNDPVASVLSLYHRGAVMPYWGGGVFAARALRANDVMYYALMNHARGRGCDRFDFGRSKTGQRRLPFQAQLGLRARAAVLCGVVGGRRSSARRQSAQPSAIAPRSPRGRNCRWPIANRLGPLIATGLALTGAAMGEILFLAHRDAVSARPRRQDPLVPHAAPDLARWRRFMSRALADDEADWSHEPELAALSASLCLVARTKSVPASRRIAGAGNVASPSA